MGQTVVWIEDDIYIIGSIVEPLEKAGVTVAKFRSLREALDNIETIRSSQLIVLDVLMPLDESRNGTRYGGLGFVEALKAAGIAVPLVILTVVTNPEVREKLAALGVDPENILRKPILPSVLKEHVLRVLGTSKA